MLFPTRLALSRILFQEFKILGSQGQVSCGVDPAPDELSFELSDIVNGLVIYISKHSFYYKSFNAKTMIATPLLLSEVAHKLGGCDEHGVTRLIIIVTPDKRFNIDNV